MAITITAAPTIEVARRAVVALRAKGYDALTDGWFVHATAGECVVALAIVVASSDVTAHDRTSWAVMS